MSRAARLEPNAWQTPVLRLVPALAVAPLPVEGDPLDFLAGVGSATARVPNIRFLMALVAHLAALGFLRVGRVLPASKRNVRLLEIEGQRTARRVDLIFAKLADICDAAGVAPPEPATRPQASYLRLVPPDTGGGAA